MVSTLAAGLILLALAGWAFWAVRRIRRRKGRGCGSCSQDCPYRGSGRCR